MEQNREADANTAPYVSPLQMRGGRGSGKGEQCPWPGLDCDLVSHLSRVNVNEVAESYYVRVKYSSQVILKNFSQNPDKWSSTVNSQMQN